MRLSYLIKETNRTITRNLNQFLLSSTVISICLLMLGIFLILTVNVFKLTRSVASSAEIYAFLSDDVADDPALLLQRVTHIAGIKTVKFVSKSEALKELQTDLEDDSLLIKTLGTDPIPASIRITVDPDYANIHDLTVIENKLLRLPGIAEVWSGKEILNELHQITRTILFVDTLILVIITCSIVFITFQTVENFITRRSQEIEIMELVGASQFSIQFPFVVHGGLQGLLGGIIAYLLIFVIYRLTVTILPLPYYPMLTVFGITITLGTLLGIGGSFIALNRLPTTLSEKPRPRNS